MSHPDRKEWLESRNIAVREADKIVGQLANQYMWLGKALHDEPVPGVMLELELVQLVRDIQLGRFPLKR